MSDGTAFRSSGSIASLTASVVESIISLVSVSLSPSVSRFIGTSEYPTITSVVRHRATTTRVNRSPWPDRRPNDHRRGQADRKPGCRKLHVTEHVVTWHTGSRSEQPQRRIATRTAPGHHTRLIGSQMQKGSRRG
jgi:hypothetical protein